MFLQDLHTFAPLRIQFFSKKNRHNFRKNLKLTKVHFSFFSILHQKCYFSSDFRWGLKSNKSYWYENLKLYRQKKLEDWDYPINKLNEDIKYLINNIK